MPSETSRKVLNKASSKSSDKSSRCWMSCLVPWNQLTHPATHPDKSGINDEQCTSRDSVLHRFTGENQTFLLRIWRYDLIILLCRATGLTDDRFKRVKRVRANNHPVVINTTCHRSPAKPGLSLPVLDRVTEGSSNIICLAFLGYRGQKPRSFTVGIPRIVKRVLAEGPRIWGPFRISFLCLVEVK